MRTILVHKGIVGDEERCEVLYENDDPLMANGSSPQTVMLPLITIIE